MALRYFLRIVQPEAESAGNLDFAFACYAIADELGRKLPSLNGVICLTH